MAELNCDVIVWVGPKVSTAWRTKCTHEEMHPSLMALAGLQGEVFVRGGGFFGPGTPVYDVVDLGTHNRIECTLGDHRVIIERSSLN